MAQLRDAKTSECLFEGTSLEVAAIAEEFGDDVIFDDVGEKFDPKAVLKASEENLQGLDAVAKDSKEDKTVRDRARDAVKAERAEIEKAKKQVAKVKKALRR